MEDVERPVMALAVTTKQQQRVVGVCVRSPRARSDKQDTKAWTLTLYHFMDNEQLSNVDALLIQINPGECHYSEGGRQGDAVARKVLGLLERHGVEHMATPSAAFRGKELEQDLRGLLGESSLAHYGAALENELAMSCVAALVKQLDLVSLGCGTHTLEVGDLGGHVKLDGAAMAAMNLLPDPQFPVQNGSVFDVLNKCKTGMGARLLERWLRQPLLSRASIERRQDLVQTFRDDAFLRDQLQEQGLRGIPDLEKLQARLAKQRATLSDLVFLYDFTDALAVLTQDLERAGKPLVDEAFVEPLRQRGEDLQGLRNLVSEVVDLEDRAHLRVSPRHSDELAALKQDLDQTLADIHREHEEARDGWGHGLDIKLDEHKTHGWVLRTTKKKEEKTLKKRHPNAVTLAVQASGVLFTVRDGLKDLSERHRELSEQYEVVQEALVKQAVGVAATYVPVLEAATTTISQLDVLVSLAHVAALAPSEYVRPTLTDMGTGNIELVAARHPCVEMQDGMAFIPNNYTLDRERSRFQIITGPNMGGKSTYIRQLGAIVIMAQIGAFVPCSRATVSIVDCVLARVGAGDCQQRGISTFMAEMLEASSILQTATPASLVIIDELGRGTSTYDGFGLAWAISEALLNTTRCFSLFATHFHELTELEGQHAGVTNLHVSAHTTDDAITMLYEVKPGPCLRSFGIHVAELAKFPAPVIEEAKRKAAELETFGGSSGSSASGSDSASNKRARVDAADSPASAEDLEAQRLVRHFLGAFANAPVRDMPDDQVMAAVQDLTGKMFAAADQTPGVRQALEGRFAAVPMEQG